MSKKVVFVGLSGGVDSSVSALRLLRRGYMVVGVFIKVWQPDFIVCDWERERLDAMRVASHLNIPFTTFDAETAYKREVADYLIREYALGRTPNPDVACNRHVKFGVFLDFALSHGADMVATGHYAQIVKNNDEYQLLRGVDTLKDQSYFLWTLNHEQRSHILLPIGDSRKVDIRKEAQRAGLHTSEKRDSQGICFLGHVDMHEFLSHFVPTESGPVFNTHGEYIGEHDGALFYTLGQRHGFHIHQTNDGHGPYYVIAKNIEKNTITVSHELPTFAGRHTNRIVISDINEIGSGFLKTMKAEFRYHQEPFTVSLLERTNERAILEIADTNIEYPSSGQSCVLYANERCVGGGVII